MDLNTGCLSTKNEPQKYMHVQAHTNALTL